MVSFPTPKIDDQTGDMGYEDGEREKEKSLNVHKKGTFSFKGREDTPITGLAKVQYWRRYKMREEIERMSPVTFPANLLVPNVPVAVSLPSSATHFASSRIPSTFNSRIDITIERGKKSILQILFAFRLPSRHGKGEGNDVFPREREKISHINICLEKSLMFYSRE